MLYLYEEFLNKSFTENDWHKKYHKKLKKIDPDTKRPYSEKINSNVEKIFNFFLEKSFRIRFYGNPFKPSIIWSNKFVLNCTIENNFLIFKKGDLEIDRTVISEKMEIPKGFNLTNWMNRGDHKRCYTIQRKSDSAYLTSVDKSNKPSFHKNYLKAKLLFDLDGVNNFIQSLEFVTGKKGGFISNQ